MTRSRARHTVDRDNDWCLMWTAPPGQAVTVSGDWQVRRARQRWRGYREAGLAPANHDV